MKQTRIVTIGLMSSDCCC